MWKLLKDDKWLYLLVVFAAYGATAMIHDCASVVNAQVAPQDDPLVQCFDEPPSCEYGRRLVCWKGKWYCAADKKAFGR